MSLYTKTRNTPTIDMDRPRHCHTEWSQTEKEKYHMIPLIRGILKKWYKWTNLQKRNRVTDVENKLMVTKEERGIGTNWEIGIDIYTVVYMIFWSKKPWWVCRRTMMGVGPGWQRSGLNSPGIDPPGEHLAGSSASKLNSPRESVIWLSCT